MRKPEIAGLVLALLVLVGLPTAAFGYQNVLRSRPDSEFTLVGSGSQWNQQVLQVRQGEKVRLRLTSGDVLHGFTLGGYVDALDVYPGKVKEVEFAADRVGTFLYVCTIVCGPKHGLMVGKLIVQPDIAT